VQGKIKDPRVYFWVRSSWPSFLYVARGTRRQSAVDIDIFSSLEWVWFPGDVSNIHLILEQELLRDKGGGRLCQGKDIKSC